MCPAASPARAPCVRTAAPPLAYRWRLLPEDWREGGRQQIRWRGGRRGRAALLEAEIFDLDGLSHKAQAQIVRNSNPNPNLNPNPNTNPNPNQAQIVRNSNSDPNPNPNPSPNPNQVGTSAASANATYEYIDLWSRSTTWGGGPPPVEGDSVWIQPGQKILYDASSPRLYMLIIQVYLLWLYLLWLY